MLHGESLSPASTTDSFAVNATAGGGETRLVLVDSGANTLYTESKRNLTNIRAATIQITGVNGTSVAQRVGNLPLMVTNKGQPILLKQDCVISNDQDIQNTHTPRTIVTPKHLNENGISVYFANGTTVLLMADTAKLFGTVIHQEKFSEGLAHLRDHGDGKLPTNAKVTPPQLVTVGAAPSGRRRQLKTGVIAAALSTKALAWIKNKPAISIPEAVKMDKSSWERWNPELLIKLRDQCVGDKPLIITTPLIPLLVVTSAPLDARCGKLKREVISSYLTSLSSPFGVLMTQKGGVCLSQDVLTKAVFHVKSKFPFTPRAKSQEPRAESQEARAKSQEPRAKSREPRAKSQEP